MNAEHGAVTADPTPHRGGNEKPPSKRPRPHHWPKIRTLDDLRAHKCACLGAGRNDCPGVWTRGLEFHGCAAHAEHARIINAIDGGYAKALREWNDLSRGQRLHHLVRRDFTFDGPTTNALVNGLGFHHLWPSPPKAVTDMLRARQRWIRVRRAVKAFRLVRYWERSALISGGDPDAVTTGGCPGGWIKARDVGAWDNDTFIHTND